MKPEDKATSELLVPDVLVKDFDSLVHKERAIRAQFPGALEQLYDDLLEHPGDPINDEPRTRLEVFAYVHANNRFELRPSDDEDGPDVLVCHAHYKNTVSSYMSFTWNPATQDWEE